MKAILVIDMPDGTKIEEYRVTYVVYNLQGRKGVQGVGIPLKPLPEKEMILNYPEYRENDYAQGWNDCLKEITGEE